MQATATVSTVTIPMGPVASQEVIKELGTNGGGFFNANSAHPFENPTPLSNFMEILLILLIPAALTYTFGVMVGNTRQGWVLLAVMLFILLGAFGVLQWAESSGNPLVAKLGVQSINMEGKEVRFGLAGSSLFAVATTGTSCGAVNTMHDSLTPLGGMVPLSLILLGEMVFGGVGSGLYTMLAFAIIAVFVSGLMIGRTPEYLGKKIEVREMWMSILIILTAGVMVLILSGIAMITPSAVASMANPGAHGLSEVLYAFASMANNNGSAFAGLNGNVNFYNLLGSLAMLLGRYLPAVAVLAMAGSLAEKKYVPPSLGTLPTDSAPFVLWLMLVILIVGALTFFPALALGPIVEHLTMTGRQLMACQNIHQRTTIDLSTKHCSIKGALLDSLKKLDPRTLWRNPVMFCGRDRQHHHPGDLCHVADRRQSGAGLVHRHRLALALADGALLHLRRGPGRGAGQGPRRQPAQEPHRCRWPSVWTKPEFDSVCTTVDASELRKGDLILVEGGGD